MKEECINVKAEMRSIEVLSMKGKMFEKPIYKRTVHSEIHIKRS